jgi:exonuclease III
MHIGTWNVLTLLKPGKVQELAGQINRIKLDAVAIQEIRWSGTGLNKKKTSLSIIVEQIITLARLELAF